MHETIRSHKRSDLEWMDLIHECRTSGLGDKEWCELHQIPISTFYTKITKLRRKACDIPKANHRTVGHSQQVVPLPILEAAERRVKSYAIGRKAFLFHTSVAGANASAVMYSIIETAKANNLNVFQYLYMVLLYMPDYKNEPEGVEQLLPWSDFITEHCTGLIDVENTTAEKHEPLPI